MDEHQSRDPTDDAELAEAVDEHPNPIVGARKRTIRAGWLICAVGVVFTLFGASQLAGGGWDTPGRAVHTLGLLVLLGGFGTALLGYRLPWFAALIRSFRSSGIRQEGTSMPVNGKRGQSNLLITALTVGAGFCMFSLLLLWFSPPLIAGLYILATTFFLTAAAVIVISSGTRLQRAFCMGAVIPLVFSVLHMWVFSVSSLRPARRYPSLMEELEVLADMLSAVGVGMRLPVLVTWMATLVFGCSALGVRFVVYHVNQEGEDSRSDQETSA